MDNSVKVVKQKDVASYIAEISNELATLAITSEQYALGYILKIAVEEAEFILKKAEPARP